MEGLDPQEGLPSAQCEDNFPLGNYPVGTAGTRHLLWLGLPGSSCSNLEWSPPPQTTDHLLTVFGLIVHQETLSEVRVMVLSLLALVCNSRFLVLGFLLGLGPPSPVSMGPARQCGICFLLEVLSLSARQDQVS